MTHKYVFFQRWRLIFFGAKHAWKSGTVSSHKEKVAHEHLADLSLLCLAALRTGNDDKMLKILDEPIQYEPIQ